jgi:hypothetical protein
MPFTASYTQKLELTSPTSGGLSVGIVRFLTKSHSVFVLFPMIFILTSLCYPSASPRHHFFHSLLFVLVSILMLLFSYLSIPLGWNGNKSIITVAIYWPIVPAMDDRW